MACLFHCFATGTCLQEPYSSGVLNLWITKYLRAFFCLFVWLFVLYLYGLAAIESLENLNALDSR
jgi:hypothetical protein